jgi:hypothetical protein
MAGFAFAVGKLGAASCDVVVESPMIKALSSMIR